MKNIFENILPPNLQNENLFYVGGASRNIVNNLHLPYDIDMTGNIDVSRFENFDLQNLVINKNFFSMKFFHLERKIEITALREEKYNKGYFPSKVERVDSLILDSYRRDFTINSIYIDGSGNIFDFHHGEEDLKRKKIVQISKETMKVDGMRIYRMFRFAYDLSFEIDEETFDSAYQNKNNIFDIKKERAQKEFDKFSKKLTKDDMKIMERFGILEHLKIKNKGNL